MCNYHPYGLSDIPVDGRNVEDGLCSVCKFQSRNEDLQTKIANPGTIDEWYKLLETMDKEEGSGQDIYDKMEPVELSDNNIRETVYFDDEQNIEEYSEVSDHWLKP